MLLFSDDERLLEKLSQLGNPLERLDKTVKWAMFLPILNRIFGNSEKDPSKGGRPPYNYLMMFKILLLARLYNLSDEAMEYQLLDRLSFRRFVGCDDERVPDAKTIWLYRERLSKSGKEQKLFDCFSSMLEEEGLLAHKGQIVDASFVEAPR
ncbi:transposase, partial [Streptococcus sp. NLN64]